MSTQKQPKGGGASLKPVSHPKPGMDTVAGRLMWARETAGFEGPAEAAKAMGINRFTYTQHENDTRGFRRESAVQYARRFRVSLDWLLTGRGDPRPTAKHEVPVTRYVGAGAEVYPFPDQGEFERIPALPGLEQCEAAIIRGDSMLPFQDGWIIVWRTDVTTEKQALAGKLCIVSVKDGPMLLKVIHREKGDTWRLESWNAKERKGVHLDWAAPVIDIRPR